LYGINHTGSYLSSSAVLYNGIIFISVVYLARRQELLLELLFVDCSTKIKDQLAQVSDSYNAVKCGICKPIKECNSLRKECQIVTGMMCSFLMSSDCELVAQELDNI